MPRKPTQPPSPARRYFKEVRFRQIRALVELSRQGGFASAAASLGMAVPSVWQQIRALEDEYGVPLVVAQGPQVSLTTDGQMLVDLGAPLVEGFDSLRSVFDDRHRTTPRTLTVVAPAPLLTGALREPIIKYRQEHPTVKLTLMDRPSYAARQIIEANEADIAIIGIAKGDDPMPQFKAWPLAKYPLKLLTQKSHAFTKAERITLSDIVKQPLVLSPEDSCSHRQIRHTFEKARLGDRMNITMTATNHDLLFNYVAMGFGIAIGASSMPCKIPESKPGESELNLRDITHLFGHVEVSLIQRKGRYELPHVKAFREIVLKGMSEI
jgi:molybdate transport repressor ModE-like protein